MNIYVLRHGDAEDFSKSGKDSDRVLTTNGIHKLNDFCKALKHLDLSFDVILSSPYKRAFQSAEIFSEIFECKEQIIVCEHLIPSNNLDPLFPFLKKYEKHGHVLLASHEPTVSLLASLLISNNKAANINFSKGTLACIEMIHLPPKGSGTLKWLLSPKIIKSVRK